MCKLLEISNPRMVDEASIHSLPLTSLPNKTRQLLSSLLNSQKIIPSDGPDKLPRDWRGLASRVNISAEVASYIHQAEDKTAKVIAIWIQQSPTATVGELLGHLEYIDRFDVRDDVCSELKDAAASGLLSGNKSSQIALRNGLTSASTDSKTYPLTYLDRPDHVQIYDAIVLYAEGDKDFANEMLRRMAENNFHMCTIDDLVVGHATPYVPMTQLIAERCLRIIFIFSPEFLNSAGMSFYADYAQAVSIESRDHKIIPIVYRNCKMPQNLYFYHKLFYQPDGKTMYDFWAKLRQSLEIARQLNQKQLRINETVTQKSSLPQIMVEEYQSETLSNFSDGALFLPRDDRSISLSALDSLKMEPLNSTGDTHSLSNSSRISGSSETKKKKKTVMQYIRSKFNTKKNKRALLAVDLN